MAENSKIEWTDHTFNPWIGCTKASPACTHCYAERGFDHRYGKVKWGPSGTRVITSDANWSKPLSWNRTAESLGIRYRVFCASLADVFEDWTGPIMSPGANPVILGKDWKASTGGNRMTMQDVRRQLFDVIDSTPHLDWLLLTKRPENIWRMVPKPIGIGQPHEGCAPYYRRNLWIGTSVEDQTWAEKRIPSLLACRELARVLFLSCEPLVGPLDLTSLWASQYEYRDCLHGIHVGSCFQQSCYTVDWVITGGESGPSARPADPDWFRSLRDQCNSAGVPFHFKQWGEFDEHQERVGKKAAGRVLDGVTHDSVPDRFGI